MDPTEFEDLATKSLEGAATENEQSRLKDLLTHDAKLQRRYDELLVLQKIFRAVAPGAGLCQVPAKSFPHHRMAELQRTASEKWPSFRKRILVVDDESTFTGPLKRNLEQTGKYLVQVVNWVEDAYEAAREFKPNIILYDMVMAGNVIEQIAEDPELKNTPIVLFTAAVSKQQVEENEGIICERLCLAKPATVEMVIATIEAHARK